VNSQQAYIITKWKVSFAAVLFLLVAPSCQKEDRDDHQLIFWSSNNTEEINFTKKYVDAWNQEHIDIPVAFQLVPEGQSSEEVILAAVVGRTTPDIYANMWQGDVEDFALSGVLIALDTLDGFLQFLYERCDSQLIKEITSFERTYLSNSMEGEPDHDGIQSEVVCR
jgi:multiple sugar transport system substrate-binding protein